ncbi:MAG: antitoxin [Sphingobacteriales bacterium 12-47-4]|nr:MAG: antitoxin [Sphingobacteriales bacterium 12-47-4]
MARNTSILLGEHFEQFIAKEISSGKYNSVSEVIRVALRLLETEEFKKKQLRSALTIGEKSGFARQFNPQVHLKSLHKRLK